MSSEREESGQHLHYLAWFLIVIAACTRIVNAFGYRTRLGFDSVENVEYIEMLMNNWALPSPDAAWATSHPPFFYYLFAGLGRGLNLIGEAGWLLVSIPLVGGLASLLIAGLAASMVKRLDAEKKERALIALFLFLFLPVQIYLSAMVNEEILAAFFVSCALWLTVVPAARPEGEGGDPSYARIVSIGIMGGLALLTKLSGVLVIAAIGSAWMISGWKNRNVTEALRRTLLMGAVAGAIGGWFYIRNFFLYGYLYPQDLALHSIMFEMPPGSRTFLAYLFIPLATWTDPQLLNPDLLGSVWGSTYTTLYFDGHRHFLPDSPGIGRVGTMLLILGILPLLASVFGFARGAIRAFREKESPELPMVLLTLFSVAGYIAFTYGNPWFATLKASYLLGLSLPFAWWSSRTLAHWTSRRGALRWMVIGWLATLGIAVTLTFTTGLIFEKTEGPGLPWQTQLEKP
ncbi:MAG: glycosyltransferase family 39 protein [Myxococcota bacterium]|nr:glycosyltransferase family 39 protein [Myxococcota bacterium]